MDPSLQQAYKPLDPNAMAQTPPKDLFANALGGHSDGQNAQSGLSPGNTSQENLDSDTSTDAEGVWAPDIEQAFQEALAIYPPCGRRKIILSDEGKMYGRNELIARYIKLRTGKSRTRKQVSSHIQVLARKKAREIQGKIKDQAAKEKAMAGLATMSSAQIVSASSLQNAGTHRMFGTPGIAGNAVPMHTMLSPIDSANFFSVPHPQSTAGHGGGSPVLVKHELINPAAAGLIWHPSLAQPGQQFIPASSMAAGPQLQVARAAGPFVATPQSNPDGILTQPTSSEEGTGQQKLPFVIANSAAAGDTPTAIPHLPPPNLPLKMVEFVAFVDKSKSENEADKKHEFVNISPSTSFTDPRMEAVDILHIADKFPEKNGGLKDLFEKGPRDRFFLVKFWADIDTDLLDDAKAFYGVTSQYESSENMTISCSTKVCSFGKQVVEKVETEYARFDNGRFVYRINRSPMCDYMVSFIHRLKHLPERYMMNSVLENFTILQVVSNRDTQETLLCLAFVFEVCSNDDGPKHHVYRLIKSGTN